MNEVPIGEYAVRGRGSVDPSKYPDEVFELFSISAYDNTQPELLRGAEIGSSKKVVRPGDVLISRIVPHIRRAWVVSETKGYRQIASGEWIIFRGSGILPNYLRYLFLSDMFNHHFMRTVSGVGGSLLRARPDQVYRIPVPIPKMDVQQRIATILDKADAILRKRQQAIGLVDEFVRSVFLEMFGDPARNILGWRQGVVGECVSQIVAGWSARGAPQPATKNEMGVLKISAVTSGDYNPSENKVVSDVSNNKSLVIPERGDLLFSRANTRELVAATCIVREAPQNVFLPDKLWRLDVDNDVAEAAYLKFVFAHPEYRRILCSRATGTSGSMLNISKAKLLEHSIPLPPINLQKDFSMVFDKTQELKDKFVDGSSQSSSLFSSLSQRAFKGEL